MITLEKLEPKHLEQKHKLEGRAYIPAFGHSLLTPLYDFMMKYAARESTFKPKLVGQARIERGHKILDLGCGTATLTILLKKTQPEAEVIGLDPDPEILEIAKSKVANAGLDIALDYGTATQLPYPDNSFDRVFSSMVFHHLTLGNKFRALKEVFRVLKPGGELHVADFGKPQNALMRLPSIIFGRLEENSDNVKGLLPQMFRNIGFVQVEEITSYMTVFGTVALYRAQKPKEPSKETVDTEGSGEVFSMKTRSFKTWDEEERYYSLLKKYARALAPYYDTVTAIFSSLRDKVVDFTEARNGARVLDVGTGTGRQAFAFAKKGYDVFGIDLSEDMLKEAKKNKGYYSVKFEVADATNLPFEDNSFDVSCVSFALHDMILPVREKGLKEMVRVTRPKGTIVIVDYALPKNKISRFLIYNFVKIYEPYYPEFIKSDLEALLKKVGVEIKEELPVLHGAGRILKGIKIAGD